VALVAIDGRSVAAPGTRRYTLPRSPQSAV